MNPQLPVLYSFRRCPYAMRARMALCVSGIQVILREIKLSQKPVQFIRVSAKATVPVLVSGDSSVIDESLDIMRWSLKQHDPEGWLDDELILPTQQLIGENDSDFKSSLDRYKYFDRYPEYSQLEYRQKAEIFLQKLEDLLNQHRYLLDDRVTLADIALMPFVRQFAGVEPDWLGNSPYVYVKQWLDELTQSELFITVMTRYAFWKAGESEVLFPR